MGLISAQIELINAIDLGLARRFKIDEEEIKQMPVSMLVDTAGIYICLNESVREQLEFIILDKRKRQLADGSIVEYDVAEPIEVRFKNRRCVLDAMVIPGDNEMLLGAIPLEEMDVSSHPYKEELVVNPDHPCYAQIKLQSVFKKKK